MPAQPTRRPDLLLQSHDGGLTVRDPASGAVHQLSPITAAALLACDGTADVAGILERIKRAQPGADDRLAWAALDELGSASLLSVRAAPPAGPMFDRRSLLRSMFAAGGAVAAGAAFGLLPGTESASYGHREEEKKAGTRGEADKKNSLANRSREQECKNDLSLSGRKQEQNDKASDPSYKMREESRKKSIRQSEEGAKAVRKSVGLESLDGDWRVPVTIDGPSGAFIDGKVDIYSFSFDSDAAGACMGTMKVLVGGESGKAQEQASKSTELVRSGESVVVSFNDEPAFEAKLSKADAGFTEFDAKGTPSGGTLTYTFWI